MDEDDLFAVDDVALDGGDVEEGARDVLDVDHVFVGGATDLDGGVMVVSGGAGDAARGAAIQAEDFLEVVGGASAVAVGNTLLARGEEALATAELAECPGPLGTCAKGGAIQKEGIGGIRGARSV